MTRVQFIRTLKRLSFPDKTIAEALAQRQQEQKKGIKRQYECYIPNNNTKK